MTSEMALKLRRRFFANEVHPYEVFEQRLLELLSPSSTLLDAGCGRSAPLLRRYEDRASRLIGIDCIPLETGTPKIELYQRDLADTGLDSESVDIVVARSVVEHLAQPVIVFTEFARLLKPGGYFLFLTANMWDYASLVAKAVPNRLHPWIVARTEGRQEEDVFPTCYRANTKTAVMSVARAASLDVREFKYLGQHPSYLLFNGPLFLVGTAYEKLISAHPALYPLKGWIFCLLQKRL